MMEQPMTRQFMTEQFTASQRKQLAVGILVAVIFCLLGITAIPLWSINASSQEHIDLLQMQLAGLTQMSDEDAVLRPQLERLQRDQISNVHYLKGSTETQSAAELQRLVKSIASRNKTTVTRTQVLSSTQDRGLARIALRVRMRGSMRGVVDSIYDIESSEPFLFMKNLRLQDTSRRKTAAAIAAKQIDAEFELTAFMVSST